MAVPPRNRRDEEDEDEPIPGYEVKTNENGDEVVEIPVEDLDPDVRLDKIQVIPEAGATKDNPSLVVTQKREDTRGRLALAFLVGFFVFMIGVGIASLLAPLAEGESAINNLREAIITVSGVLSGPLGFIIGFYFRKGEEE